MPRNAELREEKFNLQANTTGKQSRFATYEIGDVAALLPNKSAVYNFDLVTKYTESSVALDGTDVNIDLDHKLPDKPLYPLDGGIAVAYFSDDGGDTWTREKIVDANYYTASSNPNRVVLEGGESAGVDVKVYHLIYSGEIEMVDIPAPTYGAGELFLDNKPLPELNGQNPSKGPRYAGRLKKLPRNHKLVFKLKSDVKISWDEDAVNAGIKFPVVHYEAEELTKTPEQLHKEIINELGYA